MQSKKIFYTELSISIISDKVIDKEDIKFMIDNLNPIIEVTCNNIETDKNISIIGGINKDVITTKDIATKDALISTLKDMRFNNTSAKKTAEKFMGK